MAYGGNDIARAAQCYCRFLGPTRPLRGLSSGVSSSRQNCYIYLLFQLSFLHRMEFSRGVARAVRCIPRYGNKQCTKCNLTIPTPHLFPHLGTGGGCRSFWCYVLLARVCPPPPLSILRRPRPISWSALWVCTRASFLCAGSTYVCVLHLPYPFCADPDPLVGLRWCCIMQPLLWKKYSLQRRVWRCRAAILFHEKYAKIYPPPLA